MPEHLRALVVVLGVALAVFRLAKGPLCRTLFTPESYDGLKNIWLSVTVATFIAPNFWIYIVVVGAIVFLAAQRYENRLAAYGAALFAAPPYSLEISGFGLLQHLFAIDHYRLLSLAVLLPTAVRLREQPREPSGALTHGLVVAVLGWMLLIRLVNDSPTGTLRGLFYLVLDCWLPFYVASRAVRTVRQLQQVAAAFTLFTVIVAVLAVFEAQRFWLLYSSLGTNWNMLGQMPMYLSRGEAPDSILRARVSLGHPIALGYVVLFGSVMTCAIYGRLGTGWKRALACAALTAGLVASMSRGPWIGAAAAMLFFVTVGPGALARIRRLLIWGGLGLALLIASPAGDRVLSLLPFVGTVENGNIEYRSRLIDISLVLLARDPLTGNFEFKADPLMEEMRQGEGIIDVVNTYLQIALPYGLVGLALFLSIFASAFGLVWRARGASSDLDFECLGRALCACIVGVLVTISTVSSIFVIPTLYWFLAGLCVSYGRLGRARREIFATRSGALRAQLTRAT